jgi:hypothetical protein
MNLYNSNLHTKIFADLKNKNSKAVFSDVKKAAYRMRVVAKRMRVIASCMRVVTDRTRLGSN